MGKIKLHHALVLAPLLLGGANVGSLQSKLSLGTLPVCATGQFLVYKGGALICQNLTGAPNCNASDQLLTNPPNNELGTLSCTPKGMLSVSADFLTELTNDEMNATQLGLIVTAIQGQGSGGSGATYVGSTTASTVGQITHGGSDVGLIAANDQCSDQFGAGAHMCTPYEMYATVYTGKSNLLAMMPQSWLYMPTWNEPAAPSCTPTDTGQGQADNCAGYTYPTAHKCYTGTTVTWAPNIATGKYALHFIGGAASACHLSFPIACCK
jgi:hypothetical protein